MAFETELQQIVAFINEDDYPSAALIYDSVLAKLDTLDSVQFLQRIEALVDIKKFDAFDDYCLGIE